MCNNSSSGGGCQPGENGAVGEKTCVESTPQNSTPQASEPAMGVIYKITNTLNGKFYVGKTKQKLSRRITQHKYDSKKGSLGLGAAIRKYGWENFTVEVIETCPIDKLNEREIFFIAELDCKSPNGYNLTDGGDGGRGLSPNKETRDKISAKLKGRPAHNKGQKMSAETCARMSATKKAMGFMPPSTKGRHHSEESKAKMSKAQSGQNNPQFGKHPSEETLARMSIGQKAAWARRKKAIENGGNK